MIYTILANLNYSFNSTKVAFEGEPLGGLQVMGILETRCLDFKNLVIMSMNERVFPRKHFTKSFIPQRLRRAFGMSTIEHQESMYAYYFYRMISRAENVFLLYDSRTQSLGSGEKSRFISQLDTLFNHYCRVNTVFPKLEITAPNKNPIVVRKDERIMQLINAFATQAPLNDAPANQESKIKYLSAHSINTYIDCPLRFYLRYVEGLAETRFPNSWKRQPLALSCTIQFSSYTPTAPPSTRLSSTIC